MTEKNKTKLADRIAAAAEHSGHAPPAVVEPPTPKEAMDRLTDPQLPDISEPADKVRNALEGVLLESARERDSVVEKALTIEEAFAALKSALSSKPCFEHDQAVQLVEKAEQRVEARRQFEREQSERIGSVDA